jgi:hypothetical protein
MFSMKKTLGSLFVLLLLAASPLYAQWEVGAGVGAANYTGDVAPRLELRNSMPAAEAYVKYNFSPTFGLRAALLGGKLRADESLSSDLFRKNRGAAFRADMLEVSLRAEYNFRDFRALSETKKVCPFLFVGVAGNRFQTTTNYSDNPAILHGIAVPYGVGVRYPLPYGWNIGVELGARLTFTDYIDGFRFDENTPKFQFMNPYDNDAYYYLGFTLSYSFDRVLCPHRFKR